MGAEEMILTSGTDLREFYYSFRASHSRLIRNSLLISVWASELRGFQCYHPRLETLGSKVYLGLKTSAMGDSASRVGANSTCRAIKSDRFAGFF